MEAEPYFDQSNIPLQTYTAKNPLAAKIVSVKRIVGPEATGETCDIVIDHEGKMPYWEGQSYGVIPPGKLCIVTMIQPQGVLFHFARRNQPKERKATH